LDKERDTCDTSSEKSALYTEFNDELLDRMYHALSIHVDVIPSETKERIYGFIKLVI